ncbi:MAG: M20 family metallopeptidase [Anaerolineae bacterium]
MVDNRFIQRANELRDEIVATRRDFHAHPELGFEEVRTAGIVAQRLTSLGLEVQTGVGKTGVVAVLEGEHEGPTVLVRADMDALPILEDNDVSYRSLSDGRMHACGHDGHTAIALGVARMLMDERERIHGRVKFVFQPAEEIAAGAAAMIEDGALGDPRPDVTVGLHLWNSLPIGKLGVADGPTMAGCLNFIVRVRGKGSHAASPQHSADPVVAAAHIITALQTIVSRNVDPFDTVVISATTLRAGEAFNVIPEFAEIMGTVRYFQDAACQLALRRMEEIVGGMAQAMGCTGEMTVMPKTVPVVNDPEVGRRLRARFAEVVGEDGLDTTIRTMGAEDVGLFMTGIPGMYFFVGAQDTTQTAYYAHHHPRFNVDEDALPLAAGLLATAVAEYVLPE